MSEQMAGKKHASLSEIMIKQVIAIREDEPFSRVEEVFRLHPIRHIPIVNSAGKLVGMVSQRDFLRVAKPRKTAHGDVYDKKELDEIILKHVMVPNPLALTPDNSIANAVEIMASKKYGALPVVDSDRKLIGIVSAIDVLKFTHALLVSEEEKSYIDVMYARIREIDSIYRVAMFNMEARQSEIFSVLFLSRAQEAFLGACRLAMTGMLTESYGVMRQCLEESLTGYHLSKNPRSAAAWLKSRDRKGTGQPLPQEFEVRNMIETVFASEPQIGRSIRELYTRTTDYLEHPADMRVPASTGALETAERFEFSVDYLLSDSPPVRSALKAAAETGLCSLLVFRSVFKDSFEQLGLTHKISLVLHRLFSE